MFTKNAVIAALVASAQAVKLNQVALAQDCACAPAGPYAVNDGCGFLREGVTKVDNYQNEQIAQIEAAVSSNANEVAQLCHKFVNSCGPAGPVGEVGARGQKGLKGEVGEQGPTGPVGPAGPQGAPGKQGAPGSEGLQGEPGDQGDQGLTGPKGPQGAEGPQGQQGPRGDFGQRGTRGETGEVGITGPAGPEGLQGLNDYAVCPDEEICAAPIIDFAPQQSFSNEGGFEAFGLSPDYLYPCDLDFNNCPSGYP